MSPEFLAWLPPFHASMNGIAAVFLTAGYYFIRSGRPALHKKMMLCALLASSLFLTSYLVYHYHHGSEPFPHQGPIRIVYYTILISHVFLAATVLPMAITTVAFAWKGKFERHRSIARWTFPCWLYVSITGVIIYWMLYHF